MLCLLLSKNNYYRDKTMTDLEHKEILLLMRRIEYIVNTRRAPHYLNKLFQYPANYSFPYRDFDDISTNHDFMNKYNHEIIITSESE